MMRVELEPTQQMCAVNDLGCRVWEGVDEHGDPVMALIPLIRTNDLAKQEQFDQHVIESSRLPSPDTAALPRKIEL